MKRIIALAVIATLCIAIYAIGGDNKNQAITLTHITSDAGTGYSQLVDTIGLFSMTVPNTYSSIYLDVKVDTQAVATNGYGLSDSIYVKFYSYSPISGYLLLASDSSASVSCSIHYAMPEGTAGSDTLWRNDLRLIITISDTLDETIDTFEHKLAYNILVR